jgi:hypothetical protein
MSGYEGKGSSKASPGGLGFSPEIKRLNQGNSSGAQAKSAAPEKLDYLLIPILLICHLIQTLRWCLRLCLTPDNGVRSLRVHVVIMAPVNERVGSSIGR